MGTPVMVPKHYALGLCDQDGWITCQWLLKDLRKMYSLTYGGMPSVISVGAPLTLGGKSKIH